jgi:protoheme IX farnesyltransferase
MKPEAATYTKTADRPDTPTWLGDVLTLAKVRLNALVVATTAGGFYMAGPEPGSAGLLLLTAFGTALVASGASAINQVYEYRTDKLMERTRRRPVADGRMSRLEGMLVGVAFSAAGLAMLWVGASRMAALVALATMLSYVLVYTPSKRLTSLSTVIGAVPGALPPLIGWAAVRHSVSGPEPWSLFLIMFFWQLPHFLAIAWMYREDYARAGMPMLTVIDPHGGFTGRQAVLWAAALVPFSLLPLLFGMAGAIYGISAFVLGMGQLALAFRFARHRSIATARGLFFASIVYLPLLWALMVLDRV